MIDLILLEQLIAFNDFGTLSKAAEQLNISQPALTRSMQRLEDELGIQLFIRTKNRMTLTDTGYYTVSQARQLLRHTDDFYQKSINMRYNKWSYMWGPPRPVLYIK